MGPVITSLVDLQAVENELRNTKAKLKKANQALLRQQHKIKQLQESQIAKKEQIMMTKKQYDSLDLDRKSREDDIAKMRVALNSARTNKEYSTVLSRINTDKADLSKLEEKLLQIMMQIESLEQETAQFDEQIKTEEENLEKVQNDLDNTKENIQGDLDSLEAKKAELSNAIEPKFFDLFDRLADRYDGEVMSEVEQSERICDGCYMSIPLELINRLLTKDEVNTCPSCGRILTIKPGK